MLKLAAERLRLRAAEKISSDCSTSNLVVARADLTVVLNALDLNEGAMPDVILRLAKSLRSNLCEAKHALSQVDSARMDTSGRPSRELLQQAQKWSERTVDAAAALVDAVLGYEKPDGNKSGAPAGNPEVAAHVENTMDDNKAQVAADQAKVRETVQRAVDRNVAARAELDASNSELSNIETELVSGDADTLNFLRNYRNPTSPNPVEPIAPDVAEPPPQVEPPVFTDVSSPAITPDNTSGGFAGEVAAVTPVEGFSDPVAPSNPAPADAGGDQAGGAAAPPADGK